MVCMHLSHSSIAKRWLGIWHYFWKTHAWRLGGKGVGTLEGSLGGTLHLETLYACMENWKRLLIYQIILIFACHLHFLPKFLTLIMDHILFFFSKCERYNIFILTTMSRLL